jgi:hypothetical protein
MRTYCQGIITALDLWICWSYGQNLENKDKSNHKGHKGRTKDTKETPLFQRSSSWREKSHDAKRVKCCGVSQMRGWCGFGAVDLLEAIRRGLPDYACEAELA